MNRAMMVRVWCLVVFPTALAACSNGGTSVSDASTVTDTATGSDVRSASDGRDTVTAPGDPCRGVPATGRCASATVVETCIPPLEGRGSYTVNTVACQQSEACRSDASGARCVLVAECRPNDSECVNATQI